MSTFVQLLQGASKSNTIQFNAIILAIFTALSQSEFIQSNPQWAAILGGASAFINLLLRGKTKVSLSERAK
jgi:hypothetical protein